MSPDKQLSVAEVAYYFQLSAFTIYRWIRAGELKAEKVGRSYKVSQSEVNRFVDDHTVPRRQHVDSH